ncbi:MAG: hypothetical protein JF586_00585 [Burkholderiales bacterium]|jgi:hypothetical protein|nr:hypothetical protein [Burkholderiales bacterium]
MNRIPSTFLASTGIALAAAFTVPVAAADAIGVAFTGVAVANTRATPATKDFTDWCNAASGACYPTVQQPLYDIGSGNRHGTVYVWGAFPFNAGTVFPAAICFSEYMVFAFDDGELYTHTPPNGTCGAFMDPVLKPPLHTDLGATSVIAGGGDGVIAGGTGRYKRWTGRFTDRVFVGFGAPTSGVGGIIYYDQLLFVISPQSVN